MVTDILCLRKRAAGEAPTHVDPAWLETAPLAIEGIEIPVNRYFLQHPGDGARHLEPPRPALWQRGVHAHGHRRPRRPARRRHPAPAPGRVHGAPHRAGAPGLSPTPLPALEPHLTEGSFFVTATQALMQIQQGEAVPVTHGTTPLAGRRHAAGPPPGRPHRPARPRPPCPAVPERGLARGAAAGGPPGAQPRL